MWDIKCSLYYYNLEILVEVSINEDKSISKPNETINTRGGRNTEYDDVE